MTSDEVYPDKSIISCEIFATFAIVSYIEPILVPLILISFTSNTLKLESFALMSPVIMTFPATCNCSDGFVSPIPNLPSGVNIKLSEAPYPMRSLFPIVDPFL